MREPRPIRLAGGEITHMDGDDYSVVAPFPWYLHTKGYACTAAHRVIRDGKGVILMHRMILAAEPGQIIDHIDRDKLNNRRANLRFCTASQNQINRVVPKTRAGAVCRSGFRGVQRDGGRWRTAIRIGGKVVYVGRFDTEIEAAKRYDEAAREHHGAFALLNFPG